MKVLFICNQNQNRSRRAEELFRAEFETRSAGLYNENPVSQKDIEWADTLVVMEDGHRSEISRRFPEQCMKKRIISLGIPDIYDYGRKELEDALRDKVRELVHPLL